MAPLRQKLKQTPLSYDLTQGGFRACIINNLLKYAITFNICEILSCATSTALLRDIKTPHEAQQTLDLLETVIAFVTATGGSLVPQLSDERLGNMKVGQYVSEVLMLPLAGPGETRGDTGGVVLSRVVQHQTQLTHLEALHQLLSEITNCDVFAKVHEAYKKPLHGM